MFESSILYFKANGLEYIGATAGILGVWFSIKGKIITWPIFIICYSAYVLIALEAKLLANMSLNIIFIILSIYGWWNWSQVENNIESKGLKAVKYEKYKADIWILSLLFWALGTTAIGYLLENNAESFKPFFDAFAFCVALTAQWMLSKKYIGTWLCWLISDIIYIYLYALQKYWVTVFLFLTFIILAIYGWRQWHYAHTKAN